MTGTSSLRQEEPGKFYTFQSRLPEGVFFEFTPRNQPLNSQPILDDQTGMCIGYSVTQAPGLWRIYDAEGTFVRMEEAPLESPLIDPTDLALLAFGVFRILRTGRALLEAGTKAAISVKLSDATMSFLRGRLKLGLSARNLKVTETVARRMRDPGRFVPLQIQEKVIRYGVRRSDPHGVAGQFVYRAEMSRLVKRKVGNQLQYVRTRYKLHVVVREKDWTITHFHYDNSL
ncbi:hypothetical protein V2T44_14835 [Serratia ficaria]|uniref:Uncharacterized protein n=1 Tax=Serratia ficaria TaxID=61651 RepID=A0A240BVW1_SERFI|nr:MULTISPECIES: hypothetical protein [Serratia]MEE4484216.1 hypothetical protein [Serratia ficaria]REF45261.1 hypothetical protein C7332_3591 [Serratia ficaria]CAI0706119.1 Uncharacterised protein [Serratia ficaria]CAI0875457.1 Uncharacterised protein [Serratia ficaria]CAI0905190.1 Uncharacterised protein [Serratia ficaria]